MARFSASERLTVRIVSSASPDLRASMRRAGQAKAQLYDWPRVGSQVLDYYAEILDRRVHDPEPQRIRFARVRRMAGMLMRV